MYATVQDVKGAAPQLRLSDNSRPSEAEVAQIIARVEAELEVVLKSLGFQVPITGVNSTMIVKSMVINEALAQTLEQQYVGVGDPKAFGSDTLHQRYLDRIRALVDPNNPFTLPDAVLIDVQEKLVGETTMSSDLGILDDDFRMTRDMVF